MTQPVVIVDKVKKTFDDVHAVDGVSFTVPESVCFGLLGPNGAGKTTVLRMIYGVCHRDRDGAGAISVFGHDPHKNPLAIKFISGVVPQENNLDEELNVEQNLRLFARFYDMPRAEAERRIDELLDFMELGDKHTAKIRELSGGMKRRLIIARALINNPKLLILDEPTTGLDPQVRHLIWEKLRNLKRQGLTIMLTTHYMEEAFQICDTVLIMDKGRRIMEGNPQQLVAENIEPYVMEVYTREVFAGISGRLPPTCARVDDSSDVIRVYSCDDAGLRELTKELKPGSFFVRQSNLEDLFLKTTGSALNDEQ
jgi:lipooligosaccharide transport system ATP-binding protein